MPTRFPAIRWRIVLYGCLLLGHGQWDLGRAVAQTGEVAPTADPLPTPDQDIKFALDNASAGESQLDGRTRIATSADGASELSANPQHQPATDAYVIGSDLGMKASWKNGLELETANKDFRVHVGGRTQFDSTWLTSTPDALALPSGEPNGAGTRDAVNFRRARLRVDGTLYDTIDWAAEYDFLNSANDNQGLQPATPELRNVSTRPVPTDLWWNFRELPYVGNLRIGNQKEPLGLEHANSSRFLDFMERSFNQDAYTGTFNNGFTPGISIYNWTEDQRFTWALGEYKITNNAFAFDASEGAYSTDGRLTWLPWYDEAEGRYLLHLGCGAAYRGTEHGRIRIRSRGTLRNGPSALNPVYVDTGTLLADDQALIIPEFALVAGPWLIQAEYAASWVGGLELLNSPQDEFFSSGYYVQVLYFLTGEHRQYERKSASFGRVVPFENAFYVKGEDGPIKGSGAWQIGLRYSRLDLDDGAVRGGMVEDVTLGLNWFLNPVMKVQSHLVYCHREAPRDFVEGEIIGFGMRFAHDF